MHHCDAAANEHAMDMMVDEFITEYLDRDVIPILDRGANGEPHDGGRTN